MTKNKNPIDEITFKKNSMFDDFAIAAIAVGEKYRKWSLAMIESLRKNGKYSGTVFVLTDKIKPYLDYRNVNTILIKTPKNTMEIKRWKTLLLDWIPKKRVLYIDVDVMIGSDIKPFLFICSNKSRKHPILLFDHKSTGGWSQKPYHLGIFVLNRSLSKPILRRWKDAFDTGNFKYDQDAFASISENDPYILPGYFLRFPEQNDLENSWKWTFIHITFGGRQLSIPVQIIKHYLHEVLKISKMPI